MARAKYTRAEQLVPLVESLIQETDLPVVLVRDFYSQSYPHFVEHFADWTRWRAWTVERVMTGFSMVYGWMPKAITHHDPASMGRLAELLNDPASAPLDRVACAAGCVNHSLVGASKFCHFHDPALPIIDSVTESLFWPSTALNTKGRNLARYALYQAALTQVDPALKAKAQRWARAWFGYEVSPIRAVEALIFYGVRFRRTGAAPSVTVDLSL